MRELEIQARVLYRRSLLNRLKNQNSDSRRRTLGGFIEQENAISQGKKKGIKLSLRHEGDPTFPFSENKSSQSYSLFPFFEHICV